MKKQGKKAKVLLFDIENSPSLGYTWGKYQQDVMSFKEEWYMLSFAYKWQGQKTVKVKALPDYKLFKKEPSNDRELVKDLWKLIDEADIVIAHNADRFDLRKANARFIYHGLTPPEPYKTVDTLKVARKYFMLNSNKLDDLGNYLGVGRKLQTGGFDLWLRCMAGDKKAWSKMKAYNKIDVSLLEDVYDKLLAWIDNHPNINNIHPDFIENKCPKCGSIKLQKRGFSITATGRRQRYQCQSCAGWCQGKHEKLTDIK